MKGQWVNKIIRVYPLETMNIQSKFRINLAPAYDESLGRTRLTRTMEIEVILVSRQSQLKAHLLL